VEVLSVTWHVDHNTCNSSCDDLSHPSTLFSAAFVCAVTPLSRHLSGRLDAEVLSVTRRVGELLQKLPRDINPVNLEELRRIKQALVELENKVGLCACLV
jgi:hypothetical protein